MTRIDVEILCPHCKGDKQNKTFKRMLLISLDMDLIKIGQMRSEAVCMFCKRKLPVEVRIGLARPDGKCCEMPILKDHYDLIPLRKHKERLVHRICGNCNKEILIKETVKVG